MQVRVLTSGHVGEVVHMPYAAALRAVASGTVALIEDDAGVVDDADAELSLRDEPPSVMTASESPLQQQPFRPRRRRGR